MDPLSATFSALAHPARRAILSRLATGDATVNQLAEPFRMSLPAVSRHLKVLERAGLISQDRNAQWRPRKIQIAPLQDVSSWLDTYRRLWESRLDRLDNYVQQLQSEQQALNESQGDDESG
jgi:DNA-binding transcriptional ArsR family regulator